MARDVKVVLGAGQAEPMPVEIIEQAIVDIAKAMKQINETRLTRAAIVALIHHRSKLGISTINIVLNNLDQLETTWLKPKKKS